MTIFLKIITDFYFYYLALILSDFNERIAIKYDSNNHINTST